MKVRENIGVIFFILLLLSVFIFFLSRTGILDKPASVLYSLTSIFSKSSYNLLSNVPFLGNDSRIKKLQEENLSLTRAIIDQQRLLLENKSLHDQFLQPNPKNLNLLPANVVGAPRFLPGITSPESFVIDVGEKDKVKVGNAVILKDNLIGRITRTSDFLSQVILVTNPSSRFAAKTIQGVLGVVKVEGSQDMILDNVLLSDSLEKGNFVVTIGDLALDGSGVPPDLIVGKIISVDKNPSSLFQQGKLESLVDFSKISEVFVVVGLK